MLGERDPPGPSNKMIFRLRFDMARHDRSKEERYASSSTFPRYRIAFRAVSFRSDQTFVASSGRRESRRRLGTTRDAERDWISESDTERLVTTRVNGGRTDPHAPTRLWIVRVMAPSTWTLTDVSFIHGVWRNKTFRNWAHAGNEGWLSFY